MVVELLACSFPSFLFSSVLCPVLSRAQEGGGRILHGNGRCSPRNIEAEEVDPCTKGSESWIKKASGERLMQSLIRGISIRFMILIQRNIDVSFPF